MVVTKIVVDQKHSGLIIFQRMYAVDTNTERYNAVLEYYAISDLHNICIRNSTSCNSMHIFNIHPAHTKIMLPPKDPGKYWPNYKKCGFRVSCLLCEKSKEYSISDLNSEPIIEKLQWEGKHDVYSYKNFDKLNKLRSSLNEIENQVEDIDREIKVKETERSNLLQKEQRIKREIENIENENIKPRSNALIGALKLFGRVEFRGDSLMLKRLWELKKSKTRDEQEKAALENAYYVILDSIK